MSVLCSFLAILLAGNKYYLSEILLAISILVSTKRAFVKFDFLPIFILTIFLQILFFKDFLSILMFCFLALSFVATYKQNSIDKIYFAFSVAHIFVAFLFLIDQIVTQNHPIFANLFCIFGDFRSKSGCGIDPYIYNGIPFYRLYGLSSEPSTYGLFLVFSIFYQRIFKINVGTWIPRFQFLSLIMTFSLLAIGTYIGIYCYFNWKQMYYWLIKPRLSKIFYLYLIAVLVIFICIASNHELTEVLYGRTINRLVESFNGDDFSALLRTKATFSPLVNFIKDQNFINGLGILNAIDYIKNQEIELVVDGISLNVAGQITNSLFFYIITFGFICTVYLVFLAMYTLKFNKFILFFIVLCFSPYPLSACIFAVINLLKMEYEKDTKKSG
jgi:hypothetical protein